MNKTIMTNDEWAVGFMEQLDSMLDGIESITEKSRASFGNERFLTDKEVSAWLKVSRRTLQDYRNNGMVSYYQLGGKILYKESDIEKLVMGIGMHTERKRNFVKCERNRSRWRQVNYPAIGFLHYYHYRYRQH